MNKLVPIKDIKRAIEMLTIAGKHCDEFASEETSFYDGADCDGSCINHDCIDAIGYLNAALKASPPSGGEVVYQVQRPDDYSDEKWADCDKEDYERAIRECHGARILYTSPRVVDVDAIAKALAESQGWAKWDTAQNCCDALCGNEPEEEREHYRDTVKFVLAALGEGK